MTDYFVDPVSGNDGNAGTSTGAAFATFQMGADTAVAGDQVFLMATGTETTAVQIDFDTNAGTRTNPIKFIGANGSGVRLTTGHYTVQASASMTNMIVPTTTADFCIFEGIDFDGNSNVTSHLLNANGLGQADGWHIRRCRFHDVSGAGLNIRGTTAGDFLIADSEIFNCGGNGCQPASGSASRWANMMISGNSIHDNTGDAIGGFLAQQLYIMSNLLYDNGGDGIGNTTGSAASANITIMNNVIALNTGNGIDISNSESHVIILNNIIRSNGAFGLLITDARAVYAGYIDYNAYSNNTSGASDETTLSGDNNVLTDPDFVSETDGSENFLLNPGSPCHLGGIHGGSMGIGPANDDTGGGGGIAVYRQSKVSFLQQSTSQIIRFGPFVNTSGVPQESLTIAQADMQLSKNGNAFAQKNATGNATHDIDGYYSTTLDTVDVGTVGTLTLQVTVAGALSVREDYQIIEELVYAIQYAPGGQFPDLTVAQVTAACTVGSTVSLIAMFVSSDQLVDDIWDEPLQGNTHNINNSSGKRLRQLGNFVLTSGEVQSATADTLELLNGAIAFDDQFVGSRISTVESGVGVNQEAIIISSDSTTDIVTVDPPWLVVPTAPFGEYAINGARSSVPILVEQGIEKNVAYPNFPFIMVLASDGRTKATGLEASITFQRSIDGGVFVTVVRTITEIGSGFYSFDATADDTNGRTITWLFSAATADDTPFSFKSIPAVGSM